MTQVAKLANELRVGDVLILDSLPPRLIQTLRPTGEIIVVNSTGAESGDYEETFSRDRVVTIEVA